MQRDRQTDKLLTISEKSMEANIQTGGQTDNQFTSEKILTQTDRQTKNLTVSDITSLQNENIPGNTNACIPHN